MLPAQEQAVAASVQADHLQLHPGLGSTSSTVPHGQHTGIATSPCSYMVPWVPGRPMVPQQPMYGNMSVKYCTDEELEALWEELTSPHALGIAWRSHSTPLACHDEQWQALTRAMTEPSKFFDDLDSQTGDLPGAITQLPDPFAAAWQSASFAAPPESAYQRAALMHSMPVYMHAPGGACWSDPLPSIPGLNTPAVHICAAFGSTDAGDTPNTGEAASVQSTITYAATPCTNGPPPTLLTHASLPSLGTPQGSAHEVCTAADPSQPQVEQYGDQRMDGSECEDGPPRVDGSTRCMCCRRNPVAAEYARQNFCDACAHRQPVDALHFVRCGKCKAEMLASAFDAHLKQSVLLTDPVTGRRERVRCKDFMHTHPVVSLPACSGKRCSKCGNMRPVSYYSRRTVDVSGQRPCGTEESTCKWHMGPRQASRTKLVSPRADKLGSASSTPSLQ